MVRGGARCRAKMYRLRENFLTLVKRTPGMPVGSVGEGAGCRPAFSEASGFGGAADSWNKLLVLKAKSLAANPPRKRKQILKQILNHGCHGHKNYV